MASSLNLLQTITPHPIEDHKRNKKIQRINRYIIEGLLQHYSGITRFNDVVNDHLIALWMGLHKFIPMGEGGKYISCVKRELTTGTLIDELTSCIKKIHQIIHF